MEGIEGIVAKLERLKTTMRNRIMRKAIGEGTKTILKAAKAKTPKKTGLLRKSLGRKTKTYRNSGVVVGIVGPRVGFRTTVDGKPVDPVKYAHLVEFGTAKAGAQPFLRPAYDENKNRVTSQIKDVIGAEVAREARK